MKFLFPVVLLLVILCGCGNPSPAPTLSRPARPDTTSLTYKAWKLQHEGAPSDEFVALQEKAVRELREGRSKSSPVTVLEQMGFFYYIVGYLEKAFAYYMEAADSLARMPVEDRPEETIQFFGDFSLMCSRIGLDDMAMAYSDSAVAESRRHGGVMMSDVLRFRSGLFLARDDYEESTRCLREALKSISTGRTNADTAFLRRVILDERAYQLLAKFPDNPDSVSLAVRYIETPVPEEETVTPERVLARGLGYVLQGRTEEGLGIIEAISDSIRDMGDLDLQNYANQMLMDQYTRLKMWEKAGRLYPVYKQISDSLHDLMKSELIIGATVRYETSTKVRENEILSQNVAHERREKAMVAIIAVLVVVILIFVLTRLALNYRRMKAKRARLKADFKALEADHQHLNERVEVLEKDFTAGMYSNQEILSTPKLIVGEEEGRFRRAFNVVYPDFIPRLKAEFPQLTPGDELLCMLIFLQRTTQEMTVFLGISRASVNTARYRLRQKFGLDKSVDLDEFLTSRK